MMTIVDGIEIKVGKMSGSTGYLSDALEGEIIDRVSDATICGKYMAVTLGRLFVNLPLYNEFRDEVRCYTLLEATWNNLWNYPMSIGSSRMIDSESFQHSAQWFPEHGFDQVYKPSSEELFNAKFARPEPELEPYARTKGWIGFDPLPQDVTPRRIKFRFNIFDPGHTSGSVRDTETLEFVLEDFEEVYIKQLP